MSLFYFNACFILLVLFIPSSAEAEIGQGRNLSSHLMPSCIDNIRIKNIVKIRLSFKLVSRFSARHNIGHFDDGLSNCKNCPYYEQAYRPTVMAVLIIFSLILQTVINLRMLSIGGRYSSGCIIGNVGDV